ncbi:acyl-CoA synthetase FdrA [Streptomyces nymphaeiformis]|uniref:Succinyl-CoA synthetase alpha subunit n=1 Tax=Streptomyces nymphaeiformis TaxID=2663842 RepID=A0A7W7U3W2_9ACTN|nr:acyl-CoA synthetase FdrA [Streptomyces nymphaeiformis]MBB4984534.1 succinyl-CoA synthetase alpha subunit [Streptomyces nymphaeiformis]
MSITAVVRKNTYFDSVSLMSVSTRANGLDGVDQAFTAMGTEMNKGVLENLGLLTDELRAAESGDLMIVLVAEDGADTEALLAEIEGLLTRKAPASAGGGEVTYRTIASAAAGIDGANLAVVAVNGAYAAREARKALESGLHVMMFSDNVAVEDEIALKNLAHDKGLFMMGPDCGTAIINNVALCFGNKVRPGSIGIVAASGTGSQEVSVRVHALGGGISQLIGTGGRDLSEQVGGIMMVDGIRALAADPATDVIVLVSKPPAASVEKKVLAEVAAAGKPVVVWFIDGSEEAVTAAGGHFAAGSLQAARKAVELAGVEGSAVEEFEAEVAAEAVVSRLAEGQKYVRGLFCGGTLCDETMYAVRDAGLAVWSNIQKNADFRLLAGSASRGHTFLDFGDDDFTNGRPHPMIDPALRIERIVEEAKDPEVAAIVMDFVLGFGSHEDPVGTTLPAIEEALRVAKDAGRHLEIVAYVLGTDLDTPSVAAQSAALRAAGVTVTLSSTETGRFAREIAKKAQA